MTTDCDRQRTLLGQATVVRADPSADRASCKVSLETDDVKAPNSTIKPILEVDLRRGGEQDLAQPPRVMAESDRPGTDFANLAVVRVSVTGGQEVRNFACI